MNEDLESLARFLDLLGDKARDEMRASELAEIWNKVGIRVQLLVTDEVRGARRAAGAVNDTLGQYSADTSPL